LRPRPSPAGVDGLTEHAGRWLAGRTTRRSFLGRAGQLAVLVAGGEAMAQLLLGHRAEARVCGQSGVSEKCPTYDCDAVWGWCWYATGCCADGGLKKICDCCAVDWPNVHGYCPEGTNVKCIVESCGADPRVMTREMARLPFDDPAALAAGVSSVRFPKGSSASVVVGHADPVVAAVVAPLAAALELPLLLATPQGINARTAAELQRLGARKATLVGWALGSATVDALRRYGVTTERWGSATNAEALSVEVARFVRTTKGAARQFCVAGGDVPTLAGVAGAAAASRGYPLVLGVDAALAAATGPRPRAVVTHMVGPVAASQAGRVPGGYPVAGGNPEETSARVARALVVEGARPTGVAVAPSSAAGPGAGMAAVGGPLLLHAPGRLDGARDALFAIRDSLRRAVAGGATGALDSAGYYDLQSIVNGFEAHKLIGVAGQGLPVIPQPDSERPVGRARVASTPPDQPTRGYWTGRADPGSG
jgi:hypothetical protein